tara:strand:- start:1534 stop:1740 length:207 start_codon:yes stop_codon:yes gene_type:complete
MADKLLNELNASPDARVEAVWFIENVFDVAFGDDATNKGHSYQDVLDRLDEFSNRLPFHLADEEDCDD